MTYGDSFLALSDPTRRLVFEKIAENPRSVRELADGLPVSRPAVSQHLKVLLDAGLVAAKPAGTRRIYSLRREGVAELRAYLDQFWGDVLEEFAKDIEHGRQDDA